MTDLVIERNGVRVDFFKVVLGVRSAIGRARWRLTISTWGEERRRIRRRRKRGREKERTRIIRRRKGKLETKWLKFQEIFNKIEKGKRKKTLPLLFLLSLLSYLAVGEDIHHLEEDNRRLKKKRKNK
jgi:hypothetical protein